jgi:cytochrome P450
MAEADVFARILDDANRADPYPLYAELRRTPVLRREDGTYVVSTYQHIAALLHDPRLSSDLRAPEERAQGGPKPSFLRLDPPDHDRIRRLTMRHFGPPHTPGRVDGMYDELGRIVAGLMDGFAGRHRFDVVDDYAYPFPVAVICRLLGVPPEDEPRFRQWVDVLVDTLDPRGDIADADPAKIQAVLDFRQYLAHLVTAHRASPGDDMLSALATDDGPEGRLSDEELVSTAMLLLIAGHETTVNLIANGVLTLLRNPDVLQRLRADPDLVFRLVEELLRFEPSVQIIPWRKALDDIVLGDSTIPRDAGVSLVLAAGNRDPDQFPDPDRFDPDRRVQHLSFGGGPHICFGAPLARLEAQLALTEFARRVQNPRLVADPPPYRPSPVLRGPLHLLVDYDDVAPAPSVVEQRRPAEEDLRARR